MRAARAAMAEAGAEAEVFTACDRFISDQLTPFTSATASAPASAIR